MKKLNPFFGLLVILMLFVLVSCKNNVPTVVINKPLANSTYIGGQAIEFACVASDEEDITIDSTKIVWTSDKDGEIGRGASFTKQNLSVNNHIVTVLVTDSKGKTASQSVNLTITTNTISLKVDTLASNQYYKGYNLKFSCKATNLDNSNFNEQKVTWTSDKDGIIGTGFSFNKSDLSVNTHNITVNAENEFGGSAEQTFTLKITNDKANFELLLTRMCGSFSSKDHADTTTNQYIVDVRLHMAQIWKTRNVGENIYWLYVEQAYADDLENPYRQRIYRVILDPNGKMYDEIYSISNASTFKHGYLDVSVFDNLTTSGLTLKTDCGLTFTLNNSNIFDASTLGNGCPATIPGLPQVKYITSVVTLADNYLTSWDRGYSTSGAWLLGPDWPYIFNKIENYTFVPSN